MKIGILGLVLGLSVSGATWGASDRIELHYITYDGLTPVAHPISLPRWQGDQGGFSEGGRFDFLVKFFSANTREYSNSGLKHHACFIGSGAQVAQKYFGSGNTRNRVRGIAEGFAKATSSKDGMMIGVQFVARNSNGESKSYHFRMPNCLAGKTPIHGRIESSEVSWRKAGKESVFALDGYGVQLEQVAFEAPYSSTERSPAVAGSEENGFGINDRIKPGQGAGLPVFKLRSDYQNAPSTEDRPWKGIDIRTKAGAAQLALVLQKYVYEGMATQDLARPDNNFVAEKSPRYWCHMPWMNVGRAQREAIHGLTMERDLAPSPGIDLFREAQPGTSWGIGFYNAVGCKTIGNVFGSSNQPKKLADWKQAKFADGTVTYKILFTTSPTPFFKEHGLTWKANVSEVGSTSRNVRDVYHIQMDIAVRDSSILGTRPEYGHWVMTTYYLDPNYDLDQEFKELLGPKGNPVRTLKGLPGGLLKMRPQGIQAGFDLPSRGDTVLLGSAQTNGRDQRLNGPADNPASSCLGCHGTAGTKSKMSPGYLNHADWVKGSAAGTLDFSQQLALAKRNIETKSK
jgi:hypothetical protein